MIRFLRTPLDPERCAGLRILVSARWLLIAASLVVQDYHQNDGPAAFAIINLAAVCAGLLNARLYLRLRRGLSISAGLATLSSVVDVAGITIAIAFVDGFRSSIYILYYPALLAFSLIFPGWWGMVYSVASAIAYVSVSLFARAAFHAGNPSDQKVMILRLATMAASVYIANLIVRNERERRLYAVGAERQRRAEVTALEQQALERERLVLAERTRLAEEVHDGISQNVYMLSLSLETAAELVVRQTSDSALAERLQSLVRLSRSTLLDTRNLLFNLDGVMTGERSLTALVKNQAEEFTAVTGIPVTVSVAGDERTLPPAVVAGVYRVLQESLANIYKHAYAGAASLCLEYGGISLSLRVADTGIGFCTDTPANGGHGLRNMRERAARLGGSLDIKATPGCGTILTRTIPYEEAE